MNGPCPPLTPAPLTAASSLTPAPARSALREAITALTRRPEPELLPGLLEQARLTEAQAAATRERALRIAGGVRQRSRAGGRAGLVQGLLQEFALSSQEGVALMCLAEALLRIPDAATRDALIRDKIGTKVGDGAGVDWQQHIGQSPSLFVNAAAWGLLLTGKLVGTHSDTSLAATLRRVVARGGEPLIRKGVDMAMRMMGEQFVTGETIEQALDRARERESQGFRYSYDMLGEAALTAADADAYFGAYERAIDAIGRASAGRGIVDGPGISIKLSALHPRYVRAQAARVMAELAPRLTQLALLARRYEIGLNIDAEESDRLELSLDLLERLCFEPALAGWNGIGFVIQAYQKRCPVAVDFLVDLARRSGHRLMVRLVKGAYWDSEIKRAQLDGQNGYPVYTRKPYTDVAYIACARRLLAAPDAVFPQFATHNAQTLAAIQTLAGPDWHAGQYEFQCLHGMGEPLYEQVVGAGTDARPCRIYAPVGTHETLLAYLVRRLLENGANSSFVNRIADPDVPLDTLVEDPVHTVEAMAAVEGTDAALGLPHAAIPLPRQIFGPAGHARANSRGLDLADERTLAALDRAFADAAARPWSAEPMLARGEPQGEWVAVRNPADPDDIVGQVREATPADVRAALTAATLAASSWAATPPAERAARLEAAAEALEAQTLTLVPLLVREAGKTCANAVAEVREAVDFLRYYAAEVRRDFDNATHTPLGPVVCISPWNFPLAIFTGQVAAALAAGNVVLAKPAEQTPLVAAVAVRALHSAGVPAGALQLLPGRGETVGAALVGDARVHGVLFTGSTEVARLLQRTLAGRLTAQGQLVPLIAETGGQNAMVVDSSALLEQAVSDIVASAFDSAGQRCSALRLLCVQDDVADRLLAMLKGAVQELQLGDPRRLATDVGPVIDAEARASIEAHVQALQAKGRRVWRPQAAANDATATAARGCFVPPTVVEIDSVADLGREVFGPVLHVLRYRRAGLAALLDQINGTGYGLTQGVHTRIDETVAQVVAASSAGNVYVNRNIVGAVVGVQPFGGEGLSGTGPKAGGPLYLLRLLAARPVQAARRAVAHAGQVTAEPVRGLDGRESAPQAALTVLRAWAQRKGLGLLAAQCDQAAAESPVGSWTALPGPTGEANAYALQPREAVLCLTDDHPGADADRLAQLAAVLAVGSHAVWPASARALFDRLPADVREHVSIAQDWMSAGVAFDAVLHHGEPSSWLHTAAEVAARPGPIVGVTGLQPGEGRVPLERLVLERSVSINTAAAGGNASLMTIG
ncbi:MAG: trifunctional transcriptional regulator/proline dehydrogenase/L-glutamate gamma-semialdehyde dehydrogenase [Betaproteobacteria bacterium]|nr:trifunctional transcriptional regulator/proline dehydrogenase/L-glutamate gamma-semialdehyde dehydrogenase [Betaproteobacteria bacterium]